MRKHRTRRRAKQRAAARKPPPPPPRRTAAVVSEVLLHPGTPGEAPWKHLPLILALAFIARALVALSGDFILHPDEIMQYLEPAHRLVFGNGVTHWEYFYGARSWLVPGLVAGVLWLLDAVGLGQPVWYVGAVKLVFCALSLLIPAGMYFFARAHFGETTARVALIAGAFWYELVGFAHKPMTEFVAAALLMSLLALCVRPAVDRSRVVWAVALSAVLTVAVRMQYAPLALLLLGLFFLRTRSKMQLAAAVAVLSLAVGVFDGLTWGGSPFHSYLVNMHFNLIVGDYRAGESPPWQFLWWLLVASSGLSLVGVAAALRGRRCGLLVILIALMLLIHSSQSHKEYRFIFAVIPLWLMLGADVVVGLASRVKAGGSRRRRYGRRFRQATLACVAATAFGTVSLAGMLNALLGQAQVYKAWSSEIGFVRFLRDQDPVFDAWRYLNGAPEVRAVWHVDRFWFQLPGYYYLHHAIPFYDRHLFHDRDRGVTTLGGDPFDEITTSVSHIVTGDPAFSMPGYSLEKEFGDLRILRRDAREAPVRRWVEYAPVLVSGDEFTVMRQIDPDALSPPESAGIRFAGEPRLEP